MQNEKIITNKDSIRPLTEVVQRQSERLRALISQVLRDHYHEQDLSCKKKKYSIHHLLDEDLTGLQVKAFRHQRQFLSAKTRFASIRSCLDKFWFTPSFEYLWTTR